MNTYNTVGAELHTIIDFIRFGITQGQQRSIYFGHGTDNAWEDMYRLILGSLSLPYGGDSVLLQSRLTTAEKEIILQQIKRRIFDNIPVPYLTNTAYFCDLAFYVDERVLIPRSPIAELIKQQFAPWIIASRVERILDLCTGSACIAIACNYSFPEAVIDAVDISPAALEVAALNCKRHHCEDAVHCLESDCWEQLPCLPYDLIIANPPYVSAAEMQTLPAEYHAEPRIALEAANNGLAVVEKILRHAHKYLTAEGILVMEVGNSQPALEEMFPQVAFTWLEFEYGGQGVFVLTAEQLESYFA